MLVLRFQGNVERKKVKSWLKFVLAFKENAGTYGETA
jgi:hypothetical protein